MMVTIIPVSVLTLLSAVSIIMVIINHIRWHRMYGSAPVRPLYRIKTMEGIRYQSGLTYEERERIIDRITGRMDKEGIQ